METPSGTPTARVADCVTRRQTRLAGRARSSIVVIFGLLLAVGAFATAQEEDAPEYSIPALLAPQSLMLDAVEVGGTLIAVGERGHILVSEDLGATWQQRDVPTRSGLNGVFFHDRSTGWAVGHDSVILRTTDGGTTWERVYWAPDDEAPFFDVWFADKNYGIAIGAYGSFFETTDGGTTWDSRWISEDDWHLHKIARATDGTMYIAAEAGSVYRSDDGGENWTTLLTPYQGSFFGVLPLADGVMVFGLRGNLFRSEDGGENWQEIETGTVAMLTDGIQLADGRIVIVGLGGTILVSDDDGRSFELHPQANRRGISAIVETPDDKVFIVGEFGVNNTPLSQLTGATD